MFDNITEFTISKQCLGSNLHILVKNRRNTGHTESEDHQHLEKLVYTVG